MTKKGTIPSPSVRFMIGKVICKQLGNEYVDGCLASVFFVVPVLANVAVGA